jgi:hypothetical protein
MFDRQPIGDLALVALIALAGAALARPDQAGPPQQAATSLPQHNSAPALASAAERQIGLYR